MRVFIAGGTGAIGRHLVPALVARGHTVAAITRSASKVADLERMGAKAVVCDVFDEAGLSRAVSEAEPEAVVHQLTAIPRRVDPRHVARDLAPTNRLRTDGTRRLLAASPDARLFVAQSVAFAYAPSSTLCAETAPLYRPAPRAAAPVVDAVHDLETQTAARPGGIVLRYGYFYGPGTVYGAGGTFREDVERRKIPVAGRGSGVFSFVHVKDAAGATVAALEAGRPGTYNVVDDEPAALRDWLPAYALAIGAPPPRHVPGFLVRPLLGPYGSYLLLHQPGASNAKARGDLAWVPSVPSWRQGFRERA